MPGRGERHRRESPTRIAQRGTQAWWSRAAARRKLFQQLRIQPLDWSRVCVALADERWVGSRPMPAATRSWFATRCCMDAAAAARFAGLKNAAPSPELGAVSAWETFARVPRPFDVTVLGMGDDGHTASLFPDRRTCAAHSNPSAAAGCVGMRAPTEPHARLSLNLSALLDSRRMYILILGDAKLRTFTMASGAGASRRCRCARCCAKSVRPSRWYGRHEGARR